MKCCAEEDEFMPRKYVHGERLGFTDEISSHENDVAKTGLRSYSMPEPHLLFSSLTIPLNRSETMSIV